MFSSRGPVSASLENALLNACGLRLGLFPSRKRGRIKAGTRALRVALLAQAPDKFHLPGVSNASDRARNLLFFRPARKKRLLRERIRKVRAPDMSFDALDEERSIASAPVVTADGWSIAIGAVGSNT